MQSFQKSFKISEFIRIFSLTRDNENSVHTRDLWDRLLKSEEKREGHA